MNNNNLQFQIIEKVNNLYDNAVCELQFNNNFQLLIAVILSAQCTDKRVNIVTRDLFDKYKTPQDFIDLGQDNLEKLIHSCGFYKSKSTHIISACRDLVNKHNGVVPSSVEELTALSGVGEKTASVVRSVGFNIPDLAVDTHVFRLSHILGLSNDNDASHTAKTLKSIVPKKWWSNFHYNLVLHGRYVCIARRPLCDKCDLSSVCPRLFKK